MRSTYFKDIAKAQNNLWTTVPLENATGINSTVGGSNEDLPWIGSTVNSVKDTVFDQIPGFSIAKSVYDLVYRGKPLTALSEAAKVPGGPIADFVTNVAQDNPSKYSIQKFEEEVVPYTVLGSASMDNVAEKIGWEIIKSRKGGPWHSPNYDLPSVVEAGDRFKKLYGASANEFIDFIKANMVDGKKSYRQTLKDYENYLKLTKKSQGV